MSTRTTGGRIRAVATAVVLAGVTVASLTGCTTHAVASAVANRVETSSVAKSCAGVEKAVRQASLRVDSASNDVTEDPDEYQTAVFELSSAYLQASLRAENPRVAADAKAVSAALQSVNSAVSDYMLTGSLDDQEALHDAMSRVSTAGTAFQDLCGEQS